MKTCLQNCKPGDVIHFSDRTYRVYKVPNDGKVYVEYTLNGEKRRSYFLYSNVGVLEKIVKAK